MVTFGQRLQELRGRLSLTQQALAERSGIPVGTIRDYEQDKREPLAVNLVKLARAFNVKLDDLAAHVEWAVRRPTRTPTAPARRRAGREPPGKAKRPNR